MIKNIIPKTLGFVTIFLVGIIVGVIGLWLIIQNYDELRYFILEQPTVNQPITKIDDFIKAIIRLDSFSAIELWEISDDALSVSHSDLVRRREEVVSKLISETINPDYKIIYVEWWKTCCDPGVTNDSRSAGGARINIQFIGSNGNPISYIFDVFAREQPYWGKAESYQPRDWVIRDIYPNGQNPMYWLFVYEPRIRFIQTPKP